jgi:C1A family cysteine protease
MMTLAQSTIGRRYGWRRSPLPNMFLLSQFMGDNDLAATLPPAYSDLDKQPDVFDQGQEGSCTANSAGGAFQHLHRILGKPNDFTPSRQLLYYLERKDQGSSPTDDSGSSIAESVNAMKSYGLAPEQDWPYDSNHFSLKPTDAILKEAAQHKVTAAQQVGQTLTAFKTTIAQHRSVMIGFTVYQSFESEQFSKDGLMPIPKRFEPVLGGHAVRIIGWDDAIKGHGWVGAFLVRNSWGKGWALDGNFYMPYKFAMSRNASDFHRIDDAT